MDSSTHTNLGQYSPNAGRHYSLAISGAGGSPGGLVGKNRLVSQEVGSCGPFFPGIYYPDAGDNPRAPHSVQPPVYGAQFHGSAGFGFYSAALPAQAFIFMPGSPATYPAPIPYHAPCDWAPPGPPSRFPSYSSPNFRHAQPPPQAGPKLRDICSPSTASAAVLPAASAFPVFPTQVPQTPSAQAIAASALCISQATPPNPRPPASALYVPQTPAAPPAILSAVAPATASRTPPAPDRSARARRWQKTSLELQTAALEDSLVEERAGLIASEKCLVEERHALMEKDIVESAEDPSKVKNTCRFINGVECTCPPGVPFPMPAWL
ncbi:hypothetical protein B0T26DRAFT_38942 [Lasiosphaeria miniovina]|uniref:Uncharacterized protein n=1 Tax=Lasiosphaeria miniovina TaxID=1954250 RepID=A0AA40ED13_9PEZI|nr:uncharacterized protein B0T26DRAFT_38942 [Lasiosphaeria miniovina]KAK0733837.1 hypothetical protein B0T26DRAFT_38942 [Lasiosphaeria miniovina]